MYYKGAKIMDWKLEKEGNPLPKTSNNQLKQYKNQALVI